MTEARDRRGGLFFLMIVLAVLWSEGPCRAQTSPPSPPREQGRWVTLILDKSGSMQKVARPMRQALDLFVDVLAYYNTLFPNVGVNLLAIYFDGRAEVVHAGPVEGLEGFRKNPRTRYVPNGETRLREAVTLAARTLAERNVAPGENMTVLMTDAEKLDEPGDIVARLGPETLARLGSTWFVYLTHAGSPKEIPATLKNWQGLDPLAEKSSCSRVAEASDLLPTFLLSLWKYHVSQMETKLVRYYQEPLKAGVLPLHKHSPSDAVEAIFSRPGKARLEAVLSPTGQPLGPGAFEVIEKASFITVRLRGDLPKGVFSLRLSEKSGERVSLITTEDIPIGAKVEPSPERPGATYPKDAQVSFRFGFWDAKNSLPIDYPEFLRLVFFKYAIGPSGPRAERVEGSDIGNLTVSGNFPQEGAHTVRFAWHYHPSLLIEKPCKEIGRFTIEGDLKYALSLSFDETPAWEGRRLPLTLGLLPRGGGAPIVFNRLYLQSTVRQSGMSTDLVFDPPGYKAELALRTAGTYDFRYVRAEPERYSGQISMDRPYGLEVQGRKIVVERPGMPDSTAEEAQTGGGITGWLQEILRPLSAILHPAKDLLPGPLQKETATVIDCPVMVKFSGAQVSRFDCRLSLNKVFGDETGVMEVHVPNREHQTRFSLEAASESVLSLLFDGVAGFFGASPSLEMIEDAVVLDYDYPAGIHMVHSEAETLNLCIKLTKKAACLGDELFPLEAPPITVKARIDTAQGSVDLKPVVLRVQLQRSSSLGAYTRSAIVTALFAVMLMMVLLAALVLLYNRLQIRSRKLELWQNSILLFSPEDFFDTLPSEYRRLWGNDRSAYAQEVLEAGSRAQGRAREERRVLWKRFARPLSLDRTRDLGEKCRRPNVPSSWDFGPGEIRVTTCGTGPWSVRHRHEGVGEVGTLRAQIFGEVIASVTFTPFDTAVLCDNSPCLPGNPRTLRNGSVCSIGPDYTSPCFLMEVAWDARRIHVSLRR